MIRILAVLLLAPAIAQAGGFHISILGVRRTGMMTNLADPDDVTALFHNPAGLPDLSGTRVHLSSGVTFLDTNISLQELDPDRFPEINAPNCDEPEALPCWPVSDGYYEANIGPEKYIGVIPYLGASQNLGVWSESLEDVGISFAAYAPGAYGAYLPNDAPTAYFVVDGLFIVAAATAGAGWRINDWLSVGANFSYNYMQLGYSQKFSTVDILTDEGAEPDLESRLAQATVGDLELDYQGKDHGFGWGVAALINPWDWLAIAVAYNGATSARFEGDVTVRGLGSTITGSAPNDPDDLARVVGSLGFKLPRTLEVEMPIPPSVMAGVNVTPVSWIEIGFDFRWWLYNVFDVQTLRPIYDPDDPNEAPLTEESLSRDKGYSSSFEVALGVLARPFASAPELELMAGVAFDKSPVPDRTFSIDNPSMNQAIVSAGVRYTLLETWRLGAGYMMINYLERDVTTSETSPPTNARVSGRSHIPTLEVEVLF